MKKKGQKKIITRFAPSPTGVLHIGSARTALFNFLFAKKYDGKMLLRIEDTDKARSKKEYENDIFEGLSWLGISWAEPIYRQSERTAAYASYLKEMVENGLAYISREKTKGVGEKSEVIRFKNPNKKIIFNDIIHGDIIFDTTELGDFIIAKDFETPLYHLAVVVDDFEMGITHIIRGDDGISNTPRQILIQEAIGAERPIYVHIPLILAPDKSKLSKRHGAISLKEFNDRGYLPEAMINFLSMLGWSPQSAKLEKEILSFDEIVKNFSIEAMQKSGAIFNEEKLKWFNREYMKSLPLEKIIEELSRRLPYKNINMIERITPIIIDRVSVFDDVIKMDQDGEIRYFFEKPKYDISNIHWKNTPPEKTREYLDNIISMLFKIKQFNVSEIKSALWEYAEKEGRGNVLWPMRYGLSGREKSPDPFILAEILGKDETIKRLSEIRKILS